MTQRSLFWLIFASGLFAVRTDSLRASCGDWLAHSQTPVAANPATPEPAPPLTLPPCQGPHCGRSPAAPAPPALPLVERHNTGVACLVHILSACGQASRSCQVVELTIYLPLGSWQRIDRPPIGLRCALV